MYDRLIRALMGGGPHLHEQDTSGAGGAGKPASGEGADPPSGDDDFGKGYGKGIAKGERQATAALLKELGVESVDGLRSLAKSAREAEAAARKAAEEQGQYKGLYEEASGKLDGLTQERDALKSEVDGYRAAAQAELEKILESCTDDQKSTLDGLPLNKQLAIARQFSGASKKPDVGARAGNGTEPTDKGGKTLEDYAKKGWANLTPEERAHCAELQRKADSTPVSEIGRVSAKQ